MKMISVLAGSAFAALSLLGASPILAQGNSTPEPGNTLTETDEGATDAQDPAAAEGADQTGGEQPADMGADAGATFSPVLPEEPVLADYQGQNGQLLTFEVTGDVSGAIWGNAVYSDDSSIATAAVHMGVVQPGETALVTVEIVPGLDSYEASTSNGVESSEYGAWEGSFRFIDAGVLDSLPVEPEPADLSVYREQQGAIMRFEITGAADGTIWGDGIFSDDSPLGTAAVYEGLLQDGETGVVTVEILPGLSEYAGAERNGVTSETYGEWEGSYRFLAPGLASNS